MCFVSSLKITVLGVPPVVQWVKNHDIVSVRMPVQSLASFSGLRIWHCVAASCCVGRRCGLDPVLLWLRNRTVAVALIGPIAQELP